MNDLNRQTAKAELDACLQGLVDSFQSEDAQRISEELRFYFSTLLKTHDALSYDDVVEALDVWYDGLNGMSHYDSQETFSLTQRAYDECKNKGSFPTQNGKYIVKSVCLAVSHFAPVALGSVVQSSLAMHFPMNAAQRYVRPAMDALMTLAMHSNISTINDAFFQALTNFETMLFRRHIHPLRRAEYVRKLYDWSEDRPHCGALHRRMTEILKGAEYLPDGREMLLHPLEVKAKELGDDSKEWYAKQPVDIQSAFAIRDGVDVAYINLYRTIENAFKSKRWNVAEGALGRLFFKLGEEADTENGDEVPEDLSTYEYFFAAAEKLSEKSPPHGANLLRGCIVAMEGEAVVSDLVRAGVYELALSLWTDMEHQPDEDADAMRELYKTIMMRTSEFPEIKDIKNSADILDCSIEGYRKYLGRMPPVARYLDVSDLAIWAGQRDGLSPVFTEFIDDLMNLVEPCGNNMQILLDEDEEDKLAHAYRNNVRQFPQLQHD